MSVDTTPKKRKFTWDRCLCSYEFCAELGQKLETNVPGDHPWKGKMSFERQSGGKQDVFVTVAAKCLKATIDVNYEGRKYFIARHHFPLSLLKANKLKKRKYTTHLIKVEAERIFNGNNECLLQSAFSVSNV